MGYRSEIVLAIKPEVFDSAPPNVQEAFANIWAKPECRDENRVVFYHDCIKWYDSLSEDKSVSTIENWLESLDYDEFGFVELGEDDSDVNVSGNPDEYDIGYVRKVIF